MVLVCTLNDQFNYSALGIIFAASFKINHLDSKDCVFQTKQNKAKQNGFLAKLVIIFMYHIFSRNRTERDNLLYRTISNYMPGRAAFYRE